MTLIRNFNKRILSFPLRPCSLYLSQSQNIRVHIYTIILFHSGASQRNKHRICVQTTTTQQKNSFRINKINIDLNIVEITDSPDFVANIL